MLTHVLEQADSIRIHITRWFWIHYIVFCIQIRFDLTCVDKCMLQRSFSQATSNRSTRNCAVLKQTKSLLEIDRSWSRNQTLLLSFQGITPSSTRLLVEEATGVYTGSIHLNDKTSSRIFDYESRCGLRLAVINGHPESLRRCGSYLCIAEENEKQKCNKGLIKYFTRFLFVATNPMNSIFSEFQNAQTKGSGGRITKVTQNIRNAWLWMSIYFADRMAFDWSTKIFPMLKLHSPENFMIFRYDRLFNADQWLSELSQMIKFLDLKRDSDRILCALNGSQSSAEATNLVTVNDLIGSNRTHACQLWKRIKYISQNLSFANPWPEFNCDGLQYKNCSNYLHNKTLMGSDKIWGRNQTLLLSFPGSGNTWTRLLVEGATGVHTGSIYLNDKSLKNIFEIEVRCGLRLSAIKGHPESFERCGQCLCIKDEDERRKRQRGLINHFTRFLFIARNPMDSIYSEFQRGQTKSHTGILTRITTKLKLAWKYLSLRAADQLAIDWDTKVYPMMRLHSPSNFLILRYENLVSEPQKIMELSQVPEFLGFPYNENRITCAFNTSELSSIRRQKFYNLHDFINGDRKHACELWKRIKNFSQNLSYSSPWPDYNCSD